MPRAPVVVDPNLQNHTSREKAILPEKGRKVNDGKGSKVTSNTPTHTLKELWTTLAVSAMLAAGMNSMDPTRTNSASRWLASAEPTPELTIPATRSAWEQERKELRSQLWERLGQFPARPVAPTVHTLRREDRGDFLLEKFEFEDGLGAVVPGYLLLPKKVVGRAPAILYCHWHGDQYDIGKEELFGTNALPVPPGPELVRRGFIVMAIDACGFGERNGQGPGGGSERGGAGELTASKFNLWLGRSLWGMIVRDDLMALDYLCARPEVDAARIGVTGISMGSTRAWWVMALDDRPRTGVGVCCLTRYQNLIEEEGLHYHGIYYFVPGMLRHFDTETVVALAAPRPLLFQSGELDGGSPPAGIRLIESKVRPAYQLYGKENDLVSILHPGVGHQYTPGMWQRTLEWLEQRLRAK